MSGAYEKLKAHREMVSRASKIQKWVLMKDGSWVKTDLSKARKLILSGKAVRFATVDEDLEMDGL